MALRIPKILDDLLDVSGSASDGQALAYSSAGATWRPSASFLPLTGGQITGPLAVSGSVSSSDSASFVSQLSLYDPARGATAYLTFSAPLGTPPDITVRTAGRIILDSYETRMTGANGAMATLISFRDAAGIFVTGNPGAGAGGVSGFDFFPDIDTTKPVYLRNLRVVDSTSSIGFVLGTINALTSSGAKLLSLRTRDVEQAYVDISGSVVAGPNAIPAALDATSVAGWAGVWLGGAGIARTAANYALLCDGVQSTTILNCSSTVGNIYFRFGNVTKASLDSNGNMASLNSVSCNSYVATPMIAAGGVSVLTLKGYSNDGAFSIGTIIDTINALTSPGAKSLSVRNSGTEVMYVSGNGDVVVVPRTRPDLLMKMGLFADMPALWIGSSTLNPAYNNPVLGVYGAGQSAFLNSPSGPTQIRTANTVILQAFPDAVEVTGALRMSGALSVNDTGGGEAVKINSSQIFVKYAIRNGNGKTVWFGNQNDAFVAASGGANLVLSYQDGVPALTADTYVPWTNSLFSIRNSGSEKAYVDKDGHPTWGLTTTPTGSILATWNTTSQSLSLKSVSTEFGGASLGMPIFSPQNGDLGVDGNLNLTMGKRYQVGQGYLSSSSGGGTFLGHGGSTALAGLKMVLGNDAAFQGPLVVLDGSQTRTLFQINSPVVDGPTAVAMFTDTSASLTGSGAKLLSIRNSGTEQAYVDSSGNIAVPQEGFYYTALDKSSGIRNTVALGGGFQFLGTARLVPFAQSSIGLAGNVVDGATGIGVKFGNTNALSTPGSKIASFYSDNWTTEKAYIDSSGSVFSSGSRLGRFVAPPASATGTGIAGDFAASGSFIYVCVSANSWIRASASAW